MGGCCSCIGRVHDDQLEVGIDNSDHQQISTISNAPFRNNFISKLIATLFRQRKSLPEKTEGAVDQSNNISSVNQPQDDDDDQADEYICITCFEEYTLENPKITLKCSHHYHLACIFEWMERSQFCPKCRVLMQFNESP